MKKVDINKEIQHVITQNNYSNQILNTIANQVD